MTEASSGFDTLLQSLIAKQVLPLKASIAETVEALKSKVEVAQMEQALKSKAEVEVHARIAQMEQDLRGMASASDMHELAERSKACEQALKSKADISIDARLANVERGLQERVNVSDFQQLHEQLITSQRTLTSSMEEKAGRCQMLQLEQALEGLLQHDIDSTRQLQQLEGTISSVGEGLQRVDNVLLDTPTQGQMQLLETAVANMQAQARQVEQTLKEKASLTDIAVKLSTIENSIDDRAGLEHVQRFEGLLNGMEGRVERAEQILHEELGSGQLRQFECSLMKFQMQITEIEGVLKSKADVSEIEQALKRKADADVKVLAHIAQMEHDLRGMASVAVVHELAEQSKACEQALKNKADINIDARVAIVERGLQKKTNADDFQQLHEQLLNSQHILASSMEEKAGRAQVLQLEQAVEGLLQHDIDSTKKLQQLEGTISSVGEGLQQVDKVLLDTPTQGQMQLLETAVANIAAQARHVEQTLTEKASLTDIAVKLSTIEECINDTVRLEHMQRFEGLLKGMEGRVERAEQILHEEIGSGQIQQFEGSLVSCQMQITSIEESLRSKADVSEIEQALKRKADVGIHAHVAHMEQDLRGRASAADMHELAERSEACEQALKSKAEINIDARVANVEVGLREKVNVSDFQQLHEQLLTCQRTWTSSMEEKAERGQMLQLEQALEGLLQHDIDSTKQLQQLEGTISSFGEGLQRIDKVLLDMPTQGQMQVLETAVADMQGQAGQVEQALKENAFLTDIAVKLSTIEKNIEEKVGLEHVQRFEELLKGVEGHVERAEQILHELSRQLRRFEGSLMSFQTRIIYVEAALKSKADVSEIDQALKSKEEVGVLARILEMEQDLRGMASVVDMHELAERSKACEQALKSKADIKIDARVAKVEKCLLDKVSTSDFQQLHEQLATSQHILQSSIDEKAGCVQLMQLETALEHLVSQHIIDSAKQLKQLEDTISSVGEGLESSKRAELTEMKQANSEEASCFQDYTKNLPEPSVTFPGTRHGAPICTHRAVSMPGCGPMRISKRRRTVMEWNWSLDQPHP